MRIHIAADHAGFELKAALVEHLTAAGHDVVVVDASKHPSYYFLLRRLADHDVRLLHVVRDPRGVAALRHRRSDR